MRAQVQEAGEGADLVDGDEKAGLLRAPGGGLAPLLLRLGVRRRLGDRLGLEPPEVGMVAAEIPAAAVAGAAGTCGRIGVLAKEELREALGERELADAARSVHEERMRQPLAPALQRLEDRLVQGCIYRPSSAVLICSRTCAAF